MTSLLRQAGVLHQLEGNLRTFSGESLQLADQATEFNNIVEMLASNSAITSLLAATVVNGSNKSAVASTKSHSGPWTSANGRRLLLRVLVQYFISATSDITVQLRGLDLLQASLLSGELRVSDMHQLLQLLEFAANSNTVGANNIELRRKCLTMLWTFERFVSGEESGVGAPNGTVSGQLLALTCNLPQLRNAIQATRLRMEMSPSEPSPHPSKFVSDCTKFDADYENFMLKDITVELQNTLMSTISSSTLTASQQQFQQKRESKRISSGKLENIHSVDDGASTTLIRPSLNGLADAGLEFGVFSLAALQLVHQRPAPSGTQATIESETGLGSRISCAELLCLVDDVQSAFFSPSPPGQSTHLHTKSDLITKSRNSAEQAELEFLQNSGTFSVSHTGNGWVRLTGSADPVVLLGCHSLDDTNIMHVHVRVINSSGFKIPYFSLQMLLKYSGDGFSKHQHNREQLFEANGAEDSHIHGQDVDDGGLDIVMLTDKELTLAGDEFFLPNALVEKEFQFKLRHFCSIDVLFRIIYSDLQAEDLSSIFIVPHPVDTTSVMTGSLDRPVSVSDPGGNQRGARQGGSSSSARSFTHSVNCAPLRISTLSQLLPYGSGVFTSMRSLLDMSVRNKIPLSVMQAQCGRMSHIGSGVITFNDVLLGKVGVDNLASALACAVQSRARGSNGNNQRLGACAWLGQVEMAERKGSSSTQLLGWCLQTVFGQEICIKVSIFPALSSASNRTGGFSNVGSGSNGLRGQRGLVEVQCSDVRTLHTVFRDVDALLDVLTGGLLQYVDEHSRSASSYNMSRMRNYDVGHVAPDGEGKLSSNNIAYSRAPKDRYNKFAAAVSDILNMK
jgi:hypothetical protein